MTQRCQLTNGLCQAACCVNHGCTHRGRVSEWTNDPDQALMENMSHATGRRFSDLAFKFNNLSYLPEMDISIAPHGKNDVEVDLCWLWHSD